MHNHDPVSYKGVVFLAAGVVLLKNERDEWELPGGRRIPGETPADCVRREIVEETGLEVRVGPLLDVWIYEGEARETLIVTFGCYPRISADAAPKCSSEHTAVGLFAVSGTEALRLPAGYRSSILAWESDGRRVNEATK